MCINLSKTSGILYIIRYNFTTEALRNLYYYLCYPYLIYCLSLWGCIWPTVVREVLVAEEKILGTITFKGKYDSIDLLLNDLKIFYDVVHV